MLTRSIKAESSIIAAIVFTAVAIVIGVTVSTFSSTLVTKQTEKSPMCTLTTYYSIESAKYDLATGIIRAKITNRGKDDIYNFTIEVDNGSITTITPFTPSETYKLKQGRSILVKGHYPNLGNLNNIRIIPNSCPQKISQLKVNNLALTTDLVLNLHLDENTGNTAYDSSSYGNNGTLKNGTVTCSGGNCPTWVNGKYGSALKLDGSNDFVNVSDSNSLDLTTKLTIEAWMKTTTIHSGWASIAEKKVAYMIQLYENAPEANFAVYDGTNYFDLRGTTSINDGNWHYVAGTYDNGEIKLWVDGRLENSTTTAIIPQVTTDSLVIGYGNVYFNGTIDEVRVWNRALTADEIIELAS